MKLQIAMATSMLTYTSGRLKHVRSIFLGNVAKFGAHGVKGFEVV